MPSSTPQGGRHQVTGGRHGVKYALNCWVKFSIRVIRGIPATRAGNNGCIYVVRKQQVAVHGNSWVAPFQQWPDDRLKNPFKRGIYV